MSFVQQPMYMVVCYADVRGRKVEATCTYTGSGYQWIVTINSIPIGSIMQHEFTDRENEHPLMFLDYRTAVKIVKVLEDLYNNRDSQYII